MFNWYFNSFFVENDVLFITSLIVIIGIVLVTIYFVRKELRDINADK